MSRLAAFSLRSRGSFFHPSNLIKTILGRVGRYQAVRNDVVLLPGRIPSSRDLRNFSISLGRTYREVKDSYRKALFYNAFRRYISRQTTPLPGWFGPGMGHWPLNSPQDPCLKRGSIQYFDVRGRRTCVARSKAALKPSDRHSPRLRGAEDYGFWEKRRTSTWSAR
jgi:hypothetical protein